MMFKDSKMELHAKIYSEVISVLSNFPYQADHQTPYGLAQEQRVKIEAAIMCAFRVLLDSIYTQDEFESDLQLK